MNFNFQDVNNDVSKDPPIPMCKAKKLLPHHIQELFHPGPFLWSEISKELMYSCKENLCKFKAKMRKRH